MQDRTTTNAQQDTTGHDVVVEASALLARSIALTVLDEVQRALEEARVTYAYAPKGPFRDMPSPRDDSLRPWLTISEAAEFAHVSVSDIEDAIADEQLMCYRFGDCEPLVQATDIDFWIICTWDAGVDTLDR